MTSDRKIAANQQNAKKSTGPKSAAGKLRSRRNALRHGLATDVGTDTSLGAEVKKMAMAIGSACGQEATLFAYQLAEVEIDLLRIRKVRTAIFNEVLAKSDCEPSDHAVLNTKLAKLDRYERRALSRHKRALRAISLAAKRVTLWQNEAKNDK
jgi:hypothetical protein